MRLKRKHAPDIPFAAVAGEIASLTDFYDAVSRGDDEKPMFEVLVKSDAILVVRDDDYFFRLVVQQHEPGFVWVVQEVSLEDEVFPEIVLSSSILMTYTGYRKDVHLPVLAAAEPALVTLSFQEYAWQTYNMRAVDANLDAKAQADAKVRAAQVRPFGAAAAWP